MAVGDNGFLLFILISLYLTGDAFILPKVTRLYYTGEASLSWESAVCGDFSKEACLGVFFLVALCEVMLLLFSSPHYLSIGVIDLTSFLDL